MADPNDQQVTYPQGIRYPPSGASESSESDSYLSIARPGSATSGLAEAPSSRASEYSEYDSHLSIARPGSATSGLAEAPSSRASESSEATGSSRPESAMSLALAEAVNAARFGAPKTELDLSKLILWKSELDSLDEELLPHNVHLKIENLRNKIIYEICVWNDPNLLEQ